MIGQKNIWISNANHCVWPRKIEKADSPLILIGSIILFSKDGLFKQETIGATFKIYLLLKNPYSKLFKKLYAFLHLISKTNIGLYNVVRDCSGLPLYLNHLIKQRYLYYLIIPHILFNFFLLFLLLKVNVKALSC